MILNLQVYEVQAQCVRPINKIGLIHGFVCKCFIVFGMFEGEEVEQLYSLHLIWEIMELGIGRMGMIGVTSS